MINEGSVPMVIVTHILNPQLDPTWPTSLSPNVVTGLLRDQLGFNGVIISDALWMGGISNTYHLAQAAVLAVKAGTDLLLGPRGLADTQMMLPGLRRTVTSGQISLSQVNTSVERIITLKLQYRIISPALPLQLASRMGDHKRTCTSWGCLSGLHRIGTDGMLHESYHPNGILSIKESGAKTMAGEYVLRKVKVEGGNLKFSAAHFITFGGKCERLHGHNYSVLVEVEGDLDRDSIVLDFTVLKHLTREICQRLNHRFLLPMNNPHLELTALLDAWEIRFQEKRYVFPSIDVVELPIDNTSAERLAEYICNELHAMLSERGYSNLYTIMVGVEEAPTQMAYYRRAFF
jgi:6-pyruvoyl tetrahydropterin synthase/QueD family protein